METHDEDPLLISNGHRFEDMIEATTKNKKYDLHFKDIISYQKSATCKIRNSNEHIFLIETVVTLMKHQAHEIKRYKAVSIAVKGKLIIKISGKT